MKRSFWIVVLALVAGCAADTSVPPQSHRSDVGRTQALEPGAAATFEEATPFEQVGLLIDTPAVDLEARVDDGGWRPVEITWSEGVHKVARLILDEPAHRVEIRANEPWSFGEVQFYDEVVAGDVLTRDLPPAQFGAAPLNALAPADLVISRAAWGARDPNKVCGSAHTPYRMAIHHTASPADDGGDAAARMRQMQAYHIDSNGWCDIGYHFVVSQAGQVYQGRSSELRTGAHVLNQNTGNIGVCLIGNFEEQQVSETQLNKAAEIVGWVGRTYGIPFNRTSIKGHREHAGQSTACPGTNLLNRLDDLIARASGQAPTPTAPLPVAFQVNYLGDLADFYQAGSSSGKPDFFVGDTLQAEIRFTNTSSSPLRNVQLGYWFESPFLHATNYAIETDVPALDQATFMVNDANDNPDNPARDAMGSEGTLGMYAFGAGETKRVVVDLEVGSYSIGLADHPDVRGWIRHVDDLYGEQPAFNADPTNANAFETLLQGFAELDVLSRDEWQFDGPEPEQVEGWYGCAGVTPVVDPDRGALVADVSAGGCVESPAWTLIDAAVWDQLVLRMSVDGSHQAALYWAAEDEEFSEERAVSFAVDADTTTYVVPVGEHAGWTGDVARLRVVPALDDPASVAIDAIFVQSTDGRVGSDREELVTIAPVAMGDEAIPPPAADGEAADPVGTPSDPDEFRVKKGCSTVTGTPADLWWLLGFVFAVRRRRR